MTLEHKLLLPVPLRNSKTYDEIPIRQERSLEVNRKVVRSEPPRGTSVSGWILTRKAWFIMGDVLPAGIHRLVLTEAINTKADHLIGTTIQSSNSF